MTDQEKIDDIMDNFDFETVKKTIDALKWQWFSSRLDHEYLPELGEIKTRARNLLKEILSDKNVVAIRTGGFCARNDDNCLELSFEVAETYVEFGE